MDPYGSQSAVNGPFHGTVAHGYLTLSLAPALIAEVVQIRELAAALNYGLNRVGFPAPVRVGASVRAHITLSSAHQKTSGVEWVFAMTYEIRGEHQAPGASPRSACSTVKLPPVVVGDKARPNVDGWATSRAQGPASAATIIGCRGGRDVADR